MAISGGDGSIILTTKVDETGLKKGLGSMKKLGAIAGKAFLAIGAAAATATVAITKMATDAYADYEQLVGGVETLFKGSADKVIAYAENAFATTGQSANEYMENVTAFSASLLSAVGGDTERAADVANAAMVSISDNVNKMGSSAESVQLAFQGFAKQQYMLLDNLKLGYGGTKTEMERLLRDAEAYRASMGETVQYEIDNLADVYTAIGDIQEKLGIAGTTAREAESTISGSAAMMKAAWQNTLVAISGGGDLDKAINNLVYSVQKYFENIVPVVERSLQGIGQLIERVAPLLVQTVARALIKAIPSLLNAVYQMIIGLAKGIYQGIVDLFSGGAQKVVEAQTNEIAKSVENQNALTDAVEETAKAQKKTLAGFDDIQILSSSAAEEDTVLPQISGDIDLPDISEKSGEMREEISQNIFGAFEDVIKRLPELIGKIVSILPMLAKKIVRVLPSLIQTILTSIASLIPTVASGLTNAVVILLQSLPSIILPILTALPSIMSALLQTVVDNLPLVLDAVGDLISGLILALPEIIQALIVELPNIISLILQTILMAKPQLINLVFDIVFALAQALPEILSSLIIAIPSALIGVWDAIVNFWKDYIAPIFTAEWWKDLGKTCINGLINGFEGGINGIIFAFETMINWIVDAFNKLSFDIPDWVPAIGGQKWGINIPRASFGRISIPRLAKGAVIPPNREFLAVLGDQKRGTNIEAPLSTIEQAVENVLSRQGQPQSVKEEHYYLDDSELMRVVYRLFKGGERLNGATLEDGGY